MGMATTIYSSSIAVRKAAKDGWSFTVTIESSNGNVFRPTNINTTLTCHVFKNGTEITDDLEAWRFMWKRTTSDSAADTSWNNLSKARRTKTVDITTADCLGRTVFDCEVEIGD